MFGDNDSPILHIQDSGDLAIFLYIPSYFIGLYVEDIVENTSFCGRYESILNDLIFSTIGYSIYIEIHCKTHMLSICLHNLK